MSPGLSIRQARSADAQAWAALRAALWPDEDPSRHLPDIHTFLANSARAAAFLASTAGGEAVGFAEASLRFDYVNGTETSPVGFLEGWYVAPAYRRRGIGRALVAEVERWARLKRCSELASDALIGNTDSHRAHEACGLQETERVVYFRKRLGG
ncbi:MAG TPA: aminoglycoside 6'-N-acetyltransferase [Pseudoxanthomonas sp.]|nr:aminoglycoside 6'-N-acetyltransferase [Pseudoxanthomonas sp.]